MFLDYLKNFVIKKIVNKSLSADIVQTDVHKIKSVGIVVDQAFLVHIAKLTRSLLAYGVMEKKIQIIVRASQMKVENADSYTMFNASAITWAGTFVNPEVQKFVEQEFDLLINYYDQEKPVLMMASSLSRANFKVGFSAIDKRVNNLMIDCTAVEYEVFEKELFKYLKILNTI